MGWFKRAKEGINTPTQEKKETPEGLWHKCSSCDDVITSEDHEKNLWVCDKCNYHGRIGSKGYFSIFFDDNKFTEINPKMQSGDPLGFEDTKKYVDRIQENQEKTGFKDAIRTAYGNVNGKALMIGSMDFNFIGGSMGSVVGEKISRAIDYCIKNKMPLLLISKTGGARMMEAAFSLMQMAKTSAKLSVMADKKIPYISLLTDPTTGGITASFAMLGDINIAEPGALIGFAGPRVVRETIGKDLPEGFQTSEFLLEKGFIDFIEERKNLKEKVSHMLNLFQN